MSEVVNLSRRGFLAGLGALVVAVQLPTRAAASSLVTLAPDPGVTLNAFLGIGLDGIVTVLCPSSEMGQGITTGLAQVVADELDADWEKVRVMHADEDKAYRFTLVPGDKRQITGGSMSTRRWRQPMREAGATARGMLIAAAARQWQVKASECTTAHGVVSHSAGHSATYGELAEAAGREKPRKPTLKTPDQFTVMGTSPAREDLHGKVTGQTVYGVDVRLPDMVRACTVRSPTWGGTVASVDDAAARAVPGVRDVLVFDDFVAVIADTWWPAKRGVDALDITWNDGPHAAADSASTRAELLAVLDTAKPKGALPAEKYGKAGKAIDAAEQVVEATYEVPFVEHATMEPLNCTIHLRDGQCDVWVGTQGQSTTRRDTAEIVGLEEDRVQVHTAYLGGGFGRRGNRDWIREAAHIATRMEGKPVQVLWTREETMRQGRYRPMEMARFKAGLDGGRLTGLHARIAGDNSSRSFLPPFLLNLGLVKKMVAEGLREDSPYRYDSALVEVVVTPAPIPVGYWRSVGHSYTAFFRESFLDEVAHALQQDPVALRRSLLDPERPHLRELFDRLVDESGWGDAPDGHFQGIALHESFGSICGQVVEITLNEGQPRIHKVTAVLDCGVVVNPDQVRAQVMGGAVYGLSAAMGEAITVDRGRVVQSNFHDYPVLRMNQAPYAVDVHLMDRPDAPPGGVGEPGTPPAAPALCNAIFSAMGIRIRRLPVLTALAEAS